MSLGYRGSHAGLKESSAEVGLDVLDLVVCISSMVSLLTMAAQVIVATLFWIRVTRRLMAGLEAVEKLEEKGVVNR
jgi:hypothetical protein